MKFLGSILNNIFHGHSICFSALGIEPTNIYQNEEKINEDGICFLSKKKIFQVIMFFLEQNCEDNAFLENISSNANESFGSQYENLSQFIKCVQGKLISIKDKPEFVQICQVRNIQFDCIKLANELYDLYFYNQPMHTKHTVLILINYIFTQEKKQKFSNSVLIQLGCVKNGQKKGRGYTVSVLCQSEINTYINQNKHLYNLTNSYL